MCETPRSRMRCLFNVAAIFGLTVCSSSLAAGPPLPSEQLTVASLGPSNPHWIYVLDEAFANEIDARVHLFDGDTYRRLGQIDAGFNPGMNLSPDGKTTVVATTYFSRGSHGKRTEGHAKQITQKETAKRQIRTPGVISNCSELQMITGFARFGKPKMG